MTDVLMLIKTIGLEYDDRVRKEALFVKKSGREINITVIDDINENRNGSTSYGVKFDAVRLLTRKTFKQAKGLLFKTIEMYIKLSIITMKKKPKIIWIHNVEMAGMIPFLLLLKKFGLIKMIVWDQHELPRDRLLNNRIIRRILKRLMEYSDKVIVANDQRKAYLVEKLSLNNINITTIDNYVDNNFFDLPKGSLPTEVTEWLNGNKYLLAQGGAAPGRYLEQLIAAIINIKNIKLIVVGPYNTENKIMLEKKYPHLNDYVFFTGLIPQMKIVDYIDNATASVIMYSTDSMNNKLCSPNRLYQALSRGIPVIVGNNPPMSSLVNRTGSGIIMNSDGRDSNEIVKAIERLLVDETKYINNSNKNKMIVNWNSQFSKLDSVLQIPKK